MGTTGGPGEGGAARRGEEPAVPACVPHPHLGRDLAEELKWRLLDGALALLAGLAAASPQERSAAAAACGPLGAAGAGTEGCEPVHPGSGPVSLPSAAFSNTYFLRRSDWGDSHLPPGGGGGHPSDQIGSLLALIQVRPTPGRQVVELVDLAYRTWSAACGWIPALRGSGWDYTTTLALTLPVLAGRCLGAGEAAIRRAVWLSAAGGAVVGAVREPPVTGWKSGASAYAAARALWTWHLAGSFQGREAMLRSRRGLGPLLGAGRGATGPAAASEAAPGSAAGSVPVSTGRPEAARGAAIYDELVLKDFPCFQVAQGAVSCALALRAEVSGRLDDIERVTVVEPGLRDHPAITGGVMAYPEASGAADHSIGFCVATALLHGHLTPFEFTPAAIDDGAKRRLFGRIQVVRDPGRGRAGGGQGDPGSPEACRVEVRLRDGTCLSQTAPAATHRAGPPLPADRRLAAVRATVERKRAMLEDSGGWRLAPLAEAVEHLEQLDGRDLHAALRACIGPL